MGCKIRGCKLRSRGAHPVWLHTARWPPLLSAWRRNSRKRRDPSHGTGGSSEPACRVIPGPHGNHRWRMGRIQTVVATSADWRCYMGRPMGWVTEHMGRPPMPSPGRPSVHQREAKQAFWQCMAQGMQSEAAALACGLSQPLGPRWFREAGGLPPITLAPASGRYWSFAVREELALLSTQPYGVREMARQMARSPSTIARELRRNAATPAMNSGSRPDWKRWSKGMFQNNRFFPLGSS